MKSKRSILIALIAIGPLAAHAACSAGNGDAIPGPVYDAAAIDSGTNPGDPDGGNGGRDGATTNDGSASDAPSDAPKEAAANTTPVQINEIFVDNDGLGDGAEFVELRAPAGTPADDLKLRLIGEDGQVKYELTAGDPGDKFNATGLWTVGGMQTFKLKVVGDHVDHMVGLSSWGLDNARGAVQVIRGTTLLDVVGWSASDGDAATLPPPASPPTSTGEGSPVAVPAPSPSLNPQGKSFGRKSAAADTNNNKADFCKMTASPGKAQNACE